MLIIFLACQLGDDSSSRTKCPNGLVPVPTNDPSFCIQPYEAKIDADKTVSSVKGQIPDINVSLTKARESCTNTKIDGTELRLINYQEWLLAGGDSEYPWGEKDDTRCVLDTPKTYRKWTKVQPSGSMERCVSEYGVYDQIGNAWEWVDMEQTATKDAWVELVQSHGYEVEVSGSGIKIKDRLLSKLNFRTICVLLKGLVIQEGLLVADLQQPNSPDCVDAGRGYLWFNLQPNTLNQSTPPKVGSMLPVEMWGDRIVWDKDRDGEQLGAKVGGSFYSGGHSTLNSYWVGHIPSFDGSIGFRCTADPL